MHTFTQLRNGHGISTCCTAGQSHRQLQCAVLHRSNSSSTATAHSRALSPSAGFNASEASCSCSNIQHVPRIAAGATHLSRLIAAAATETGSPGDAANSQPSSSPDAADDVPEDEASYLLSDDPGPAFRDTLAMLEWQRLCEHLAKHSSTSIGKRLCLRLSVPLQEATSLQMQQEVSAVFALENTYTTLLDFGGINSSDAEGAIKRADKGGMVSAKQLRGLVTLLEGADRLKRQIALVARQNRATGRDSPLRPLLDATGAVNVPKALMGSITTAVQEDGELADAASEQVRMTRARVRGLTSRINSMLKGYPGEPSEKGGRICIAAPAGTKVANGVLLGTSVGGGMVYIEPGTVVLLNNELMSARAEALSAEESVLWDLSARLMGVLDDVQLAFDAVGWLDLTAAKVRFGLWLGGVMPTFTPWEHVFERRPAGVPFGAALPAPKDRYGPAVSLQGLSHPLLLADYKARRQKLEHQAMMSGNAAAATAGSKKGAGRLLGTHKAVMARRLPPSEAAAMLASMAPGDKQDDSDGLTPAEQLAQLQAPRPIDITIQPETAVVVITGPNTGGKTATMKALGLAACMAKVGMMLPAAAPARLPCFSSVLADIGDEQSLTANLSTFSGHIRRISAVRGEADGWSLLLLDELGTGTDPTEGAALGQALLKTLVRGGPANGALTIATTHHSIMTGLKFDDGRVENASVEFDEEKLAPTYKLLWGVPGRSNALNIASRLGLDTSIIAAARQHLAVGVAAANAAIAELEAVQEELRASDMVLFAIKANVQETKDRVLQARELNTRKQRELQWKRVTAIQEVLGAARPLLKALKEERKARIKKGSGTQTKVSRMLDAALGESAFKQPSKKLETALEAFEALTSSSSSSTVPQQQRQQQMDPSLSEPWVRTWTQLLTRARAMLATSILLGDDRDMDGSSSGGATDGDSTAEAAAEMEAELQAYRKKEAAAAAAKDAEVQAAQQLLNDMFQRAERQRSEAAAAAAAAAAGAGRETAESSEDQGLQQQQRKRKPSIEDEIVQEAFMQGVSAIEEAMDEDTDLIEGLQQQQSLLTDLKAAEAAHKQQQAAAAAAELEALEQQFEEQYTQLELEWHTAAIEAAEAAASEEQRQQQEAAAAAEAARQQQEQQWLAEEQRLRQKAEADRQLFAVMEEALETDAWEDLDLEAMLSQQTSPSAQPSSSSSSSSGGGSSSSSVGAGSSTSGSSSSNSNAGSSALPGSMTTSLSSIVHGSNSSSSSKGNTSQEPAAAAGSFDPEAVLDAMLEDLDFLEGPEQQQQQQQQQQQRQPPGSSKQGKRKKAKPVIKFNLK